MRRLAAWGRRHLAAGAGLAAVVCGLGVSNPVEALVLTVSPTVSAGISNNPSNLATPAATATTPPPSTPPRTPPKTSEFVALTGAAQLELTRATSSHRVGYVIRTVKYTDGTAGNTSHAALWASQFSLDAQLTLTVGADVSFYSLSAIQTTNPLTVNVSTAPVSSTSATLVNSDVTQTLTFQPNAAERYSQSLLVGYSDTVGSASSVPRTVRVDGGLRGDRISGVSSYSLNLLAEAFKRLDDPVVPAAGSTIPVGPSHALSVQALAGWRRDLSVTTNVSVEAGPMVIFGIADDPKWVPGLIASAGYRSLPWYWTLSASQQPLVNPFLGQLLIADAVSLRLSLPLDAREALVASGFGGYTYARAVSPTHDLVLSDKIYTLIQAGASLAYQFDRVPLFVSLDYLETRQDGAAALGQVAVNTHRRVVSITLGGNFAWGEGNHGIPLRQPSTHH